MSTRTEIEYADYQLDEHGNEVEVDVCGELIIDSENVWVDFIWNKADPSSPQSKGKLVDDLSYIVWECDRMNNDVSMQDIIESYLTD